MKKITSIILGSALLLGACRESNKKTIPDEAKPEPLSIEILDDEALQIIDPKSKIEILASGFAWTEGPLWIKEGWKLPNQEWCISLVELIGPSLTLINDGLAQSRPFFEQPILESDGMNQLQVQIQMWKCDPKANYS